MNRVLVIGCGGVASVAIQKCCQADEIFTELCPRQKRNGKEYAQRIVAEAYPRL